MKNYNENYKEHLKNAKGFKLADCFKKVGTKVLLGVLAAGIALGGTLAFVGCDKTPQHVQDPPQIVQPGQENPGGDVEIEEKSFADFLKSDVADDFTNWFAAKALAQKQGIMGKEYYVYGHDNVVTGINYLYVYGDQTTENRTVEIANLQFNKEVKVDDILADLTLDPAYTLTTQKVMEFNAKTNKLNPEIAEALYGAANLKSQDLKLFQEIEDYKDNVRTFALFSQAEDNSIQLVEVTVESDDTKENLLENLLNNTKINIKNGNTFLKENKIVFSDAYDLDSENYKPEEEVKPGPGGEIDPNPGPGGEVVKPDKVTDAEVMNALQTNCENSLKDLFSDNFELTYNASKVESDNWYVNVENDNITGGTYTMFYNRSNSSRYFIVFSLELSNPVSKSDLKNNKLDNVSFKMKELYHVSYNPNNQNDLYLNKVKNEILDYLNYDANDCLSFIIADIPGATKTNYTVVVIKDNEINEYLVSRDNETGAFSEFTEEHKNVQITGEELTAETAKQDSALDGEEYSF